jgi:hypothetical protein
MELIEASPETLIRQASMTAAQYMYEGIREIDKVYGEGYAKKHPELLGVFMQVAASDFAATLAAQVQQYVVHARSWKE